MDWRTGQRSMTEAHTNYIRSIRIPDKGTFEFEAYEKATFIGILDIQIG